MTLCRVCLSSEADKDIRQLTIDKTKTYLEIMLFCLDIQLKNQSGIMEKLCLICYKKILSFYEFKSLALKNNAYFKSKDLNNHAHEIIIKDDVKPDLTNNNECVSEIKEELDIKEEDSVPEYQSDDEVLSVIKLIKYEYVAEATSLKDDSKENAQVKKRGRPKKPKIPHPKENNKAEICEECGKTVRNLKEHLKRHQLPIEDRKRIKCKVCDKLFSSYGARCRHHTVKHLGIKKHCEICNKYIVDLKTHQLRIHNSAALPFECAPCGRRFISPSARDAHTTIHTKDLPYQCDVCQKKFRSKVVMSHHIRQVHNKEKSHLCHFCSKRFFKKDALQIHVRSHTKEKPYECPDCGKMFSCTTKMRDHRLIHSEVKKFQCTLCDSSFAKSGYLQNHMRSHTKEKRHPCKYCGVKFGRSDHRKRHEYTAHEKHLIAA